MHQLFPRSQKRISLGENQQAMAGDQIRVTVPSQVPKHSFGSISPDSIPEPPSDNDPNPSGNLIHLAREKVEKGR